MSYYGSRSDLGRNWSIRLLPLIIAGVLAVSLAFQGCQRGPFGRRQIVALNPQQEAALGAQAFNQVLSQSSVVRDGPIVEAVRRIGRNLARASENPALLKQLRLEPQRMDWQFQVVRDRQVNAFCLPGGKVVVYTGILPVCETEDGLATVMGHEIGHALAHHGAERMAQERLVRIGQMGVAQSVDGLDSRQRTLMIGLLGAGAKFGVTLPFSRSHESEADHIGILLMAAAGYDPREASRFWARMSRAGGGKLPEFMSTHPGNEHRARDLQGWLSEAMPLYEQSDRQPDTRLPGVTGS